jgi:phosphoribosylformylglycinamidine synthase
MSIPSSQHVYRFEVQPSTSNDPRAQGFLSDARALGLDQIQSIQCSDLYFLRGHLIQDQLTEIAERILHDPVTQQVDWQEFYMPSDEVPLASTNEMVVEVTYRPGVTDPVAEQLLRATRMINHYKVDAASSGQRFVVKGENLSPDLMHKLAKRLFANAVIQYYALGRITPTFPQETIASGRVDRFQLAEMSSEQLLRLSQERRAALNLEEMQAIQSYCQREGRDLSDVEFEMIAQTWSEHCVHKTFKATVQVNNPNPEDRRFPKEYKHLFNQTIRAATQQLNKPWVLSAFRDNAGIIEFGEQHELSFKVETHNHPSAIEPFGGANTGIGGVIRDVIGVSAKPIAATDILCFGPQDQSIDTLPDGVLHPRRIASGVVAGIQDYGNKMGIPTVNGAIYYDRGYTANPLVFCGCIGLAPRDSHPRDVQPGDYIIVLGGKTGRDGLRGATFSSMTMDAQTGEVSGASVQIGAPIVEKGLVDILMEARDLRLYHAITDCGAGGLSSAVGEMASECGGEVQLADVPLKYPGLEPWEIWLSEAQERMVIAVPQENLDALEELCEKYDVEITNIGEFNGSGRMRVYYQDQEVLDLDNQFLHHGLPQRQLPATIRTPQFPTGWLNPNVAYPSENPEERLLRLLAHPNITSKESVIRVYDHEVQGGTVIKPLCGVLDDGPADGCVIKPLSVSGDQALVLAAGMNPEYGKQDPYQMTLHAIDEAIRNAICCGADPDKIAILDNFCWGDPTRPETMGDLVQAAQACYDGALRYGTPFISGKDSFNNEYLGSDGLRHAIPPTLLISAMGVIPDWRLSLTSDLKQAGNLLYLIGYFSPRFGGSHHNLIKDMPVIAEGMPVCYPDTPEVYQKVFQANQAGWIQSAHDLSEGGLGVAAAEMAMGGRLGLRLWLDEFHAYREAFGETGGCILLEVEKQDQVAFETHFGSQPVRLIGKVLSEQVIEFMNGEYFWLKMGIEDLLQAWKNQQIREVQA